MATPHHVALVGCGEWGRYILRDLVSLGCRVTVVARSPRSRDYALHGGADQTVPSVQQLPAVDAAIVATPTTTHAEVIEQLLPLGVPIFTEKPLADDPAAADRLAALAPDHLFVMDKWRYHPGVELLAQIARSGELGPIVGLHTTRVGWGNPHDDTDAVWVLAPHDLSIGLELLARLPPPRGAVADWDAGHPAGLTAILGEDPWLVLDVSARSRQRRREVRLLCRDAAAVLPDGYSDRVLVARGPAGDGRDTEHVDEVRPISTELPLLRELQAFVHFLDGGPPPRSSAADGAAIVRTLAELCALAGLDVPAART